MPNSTISVTKKGYDGVKQAVRATYEIFTDVKPLKDDPSTFEFNRGNYQLRREFHNYTVTGEVSVSLTSLGFKTES